MAQRSIFLDLSVLVDLSEVRRAAFVTAFNAHARGLPAPLAQTAWSPMSELKLDGLAPAAQLLALRAAHPELTLDEPAFYAALDAEVLAGAAALQLPARPREALAYLAPLCAARIEVVGALPHAEFLRLMVRMDVLLYVSLTECYPMLLLEGMAAGIPVLVSNTHRVLQGDAVLAQALVVQQPDSPDAVRERILAVVSAGSSSAQRSALAQAVEY